MLKFLSESFVANFGQFLFKLGGKSQFCMFCLFIISVFKLGEVQNARPK